MPLDFPSSPVNGQVYDNFYYDAEMEAWRALAGSTPLNTFVDPTITNPTITGGSISGLVSDIAVADGGTGASDAATARTNLGAAASASPTLTGTVNAEWISASQRITGTTPNDSGSTGGVAIKAPAGGSQSAAYLQFVNNGYTAQWGAISANSSGTLSLSATQVNLPSQTYFPGAIVQVQQVHTNTVSYQTSHEIANIAGLSITFTPKFSNSKILLTAAINSDIRYVATFGFRRDGNVVSGTNNNNSTGSVATVYYGTDTNTHIMNTYIEIAEGAGSTAARTYTAAACASWAGSVQTLTINDRGSSLDMRSISSMTIYEIAQ